MDYLNRLLCVFPTGSYWVDPNDGSKNDAFEAYCLREKEATCVSPMRPTIVCKLVKHVDTRFYVYTYMYIFICICTCTLTQVPQADPCW